VVVSAELVMPEWPVSYEPTQIRSLLAGSHTLKVWYDGPKRMRLAVPVTLDETDFIRNGSTAWLWESNADSVMKILIPKRADGDREPVMPPTALTPQQAAKQALAAVGPST